jgi:hypothetical protein
LKSTRGLLGEALHSSVVKLRRARALARRHFSPVRSSAFSTGPSAYHPIERARPASGPSQGRAAPLSVMARWAVGQRHPRGTGSLPTLRWREVDSNSRSR